MPGRLFVVVLVLLVSRAAPAESLLVLQPERVTLHGPFDRVQMLATLVQADARPCTTEAAWTSSNPAVVAVEDGYLVPRGNGSAVVAARAGGA